ncbi:hypothetical protein Hanom_Chr07g00679841 [Helianthus anomalus]
MNSHLLPHLIRQLQPCHLHLHLHPHSSWLSTHHLTKPHQQLSGLHRLLDSPSL